MLMDKDNTFADRQAVTASAQGANPINLQTSGLDLGAGMPLFVESFVNTAATSGGSATLVVSLITGDAVDGNDDITSPTTVVSAPSVALAALTAGKRLAPLTVPAGTVLGKYLNVLFTVGTANLTGGTFTSTLVPAMLGNTNTPAEV